MVLSEVNGRHLAVSWTKFLIFAFLHATTLCQIVSGNKTYFSHESPLEFKDILPDNPRDYDKMAPPREIGSPTVVFFHVTVMSLDSIDESSMTYASDIFFAQSWKDWRLRLPDNMTHEYRLLPVEWLEEIWRPDSFFKNAKAVTFQEMTVPNHYIWLYQDKTILYMVKLTLVLSCSMNFQVYPHDTQECSMKIESLSHTTDDLVFVWDPKVPLVVDDTIELPQLDLVRNVTGDCTQVYSTGNFTCLEVRFTFKRRLGYYLFHTYVPTCLIVIMSWISFWLKPEAVPARVTLGVTSLLTLTTQHANSQKSLPPVSYIKAIDVFMSSCMVFVFSSLMEYALVNIVMGDIGGIDDRTYGNRIASPVKTILKPTSSLGPQQSSCEDPKCSSCAISPAYHKTNFFSRKLNGKHFPEIISSNHRSSCKYRENTYTESPVQNSAGALTMAIAMGLPTQTSPQPAPISSNEKYQTAQSMLKQKRRERAIIIDRVSRILFPASFTVLNLIYWNVFVLHWNFSWS